MFLSVRLTVTYAYSCFIDTFNVDDFQVLWCSLSGYHVDGPFFPVLPKMADVFGIASSIIAMAQQIHGMMGEAKHNKTKCQVISRHVKQLSEVVEQIKNKPEPVLEGPLRSVGDLMNDTLMFVESYNNMGRVKRFLRAVAIKEDFASLVQALDSQLLGMVVLPPK